MPSVRSTTTTLDTRDESAPCTAAGGGGEPHRHKKFRYTFIGDKAALISMTTGDIPFDKWLNAPQVPRGWLLVEVRAPGCNTQGVGMSMQLVYSKVLQVDKKGIVHDGVWRIRRHGTPDTWVCLRGGSPSVEKLITMGTMLDSEMCPYTANPRSTIERNLQSVKSRGGSYRSMEDRSPSVRFCTDCTNRPYCDESAVPDWMDHRVLGVPQRAPNSGICWWGGLVYLMSTSLAMRTLLKGHFPPVHARLLEEALYDRHSSELLRRYIYNDFGVGDPPDQDPRLDGKNGFDEFMKLCHKIRLPMTFLTLDERGLRQRSAPTAPQILGVRVMRNAHLEPPRTLEHAGRKWVLQGALMGSERCGHQTSVSCLDEGRHLRWGVHDTDWVTNGVSPLHYEIQRPEDWWAELGHQIIMTNWTNRTRFCFVNPTKNHASVLHSSSARHHNTDVAPTHNEMPERDVEIECFYL